MNACSTTRCHGGADAGRLQLRTHRARTDETVYTNFLILDRFKLKDGTPLINHEQPESSPLLHLGLPRNDSLFPHPEAPIGDAGRDGWRMVFRKPSDRQFEQAVHWIKALYQPRPEYPVVYPPYASRPSEVIEPFAEPVADPESAQ